MKLEFRRMYKDVGETGCVQALYEIVLAGQWLGEVILEERAKEKK